MSEIGQFIKLLDDQLGPNRIVTYNTISATCLLFYEMVLTFPEELRYVWRSSWSFISILHVLIRYFAFGFLLVNAYVSINTNLSAEVCGNFGILQVVGPVILLPTIDILIVIRVYALYDRNKWIGLLLVLLWLAETIVVLVFLGTGFGPTKAAMPNPLPGILPGCFPIDPFSGNNIIKGGVITIICQAIYLGLAMYKMARQIKGFRIQSMTPLLRTFFRDGALYCFNILAVYILNIFFVKFYSDKPQEVVGGYWLVAIISVTAGRLVLNLRSSVQSGGGTISDESYELQNTADDHGQFSSIIILDTSRMPITPTSSNPLLAFSPA